MNKKELKKHILDIFCTSKIQDWYNKNMTGDSQGNTLVVLEKGIALNEITISEALAIALVVGIQWNVKFEGVP